MVEGGNTVIVNRDRPICDVPQIGIGNQPIDDGNYVLSNEEAAALIQQEPNAAKFLKTWIGADEFINGWTRKCLWLGEATSEELRKMPAVLKRIEAVKHFRAASNRASTKKLASTPTRFQVENFHDARAILVPGVSSERRTYIPIGFVDQNTLVSNLCYLLNCDSMFVFGILTSSIHMAWVRLVAGRLESRYRYSAKLVYNNFPWPQNPTDKQKANVEAKAQAVLDTRAKYPDSSLADLYDPLTMPPDLVKAHEQLDRAVEQCYRSKPFESDRERVEHLFQLYEQLTAPLAPSESPKKTRKRK